MPCGFVRGDVGRDDGWVAVHSLGAEGLWGDHEDTRASKGRSSGA